MRNFKFLERLKKEFNLKDLNVLKSEIKDYGLGYNFLDVHLKYKEGFYSLKFYREDEKWIYEEFWFMDPKNPYERNSDTHCEIMEKIEEPHSYYAYNDFFDEIKDCILKDKNVRLKLMFK